MDGSAVILSLLCGDATVSALVPANAEPPRITGDVLGQGVALPAYRVWKVSGGHESVIAPGVHRWVSQRIQLEAHGETLAQVKALMAAARHACREQRIAALGTLTNVVIELAGEGPEGISIDTGARVATQDFRVGYNEVR